jgi:hypothetical protein
MHHYQARQLLRYPAVYEPRRGRRAERGRLRRRYRPRSGRLAIGGQSAKDEKDRHSQHGYDRQ